METFLGMIEDGLCLVCRLMSGVLFYFLAMIIVAKIVGEDQRVEYLLFEGSVALGVLFFWTILLLLNKFVQYLFGRKW